MVCPFGAGAVGGIMLECATADSVLVTPQVSCDKASWMSLGNVSLVGTVDFDPLTAEASTAITTPMWPYMRFILAHNDGSAGDDVDSISSVTIWFVRFEKDE